MGLNPALPIPSSGVAAHGGLLQGPSVHFVPLAADTYENAIVTDHAASQMARRGTSEEAVRSVLQSPARVEEARPGRLVLQSTVTTATGTHVLRVFVDVDRSPPEVVTVYRTSKVEKYWREQ